LSQAQSAPGQRKAAQGLNHFLECFYMTLQEQHIATTKSDTVQAIAENLPLAGNR